MLEFGENKKPININELFLCNFSIQSKYRTIKHEKSISFCVILRFNRNITRIQKGRGILA